MFNHEVPPCSLTIPCVVRNEDFPGWAGTITLSLSRQPHQGATRLVLEIQEIDITGPNGTGRATRRPHGHPPIAYPPVAGSSVDAIGDALLDLPALGEERYAEVNAVFTIQWHDQSYTSEMAFESTGEEYPHA